MKGKKFKQKNDIKTVHIVVVIILVNLYLKKHCIAYWHHSFKNLTTLLLLLSKSLLYEFEYMQD